MHTPVCDPLDDWPQGAPTDIDVATLPAAGANSNPIRIPGCGPWLGFWGPSFSGLRAGFSSTKQYPVINGLAVSYPQDPDRDLDSALDLFLSADTGGTGKVSIARFETREAAEAWGGRPTPNTGSSGGTAALPNRSTIGKETGDAASHTHTWSQSGFLYATISAPSTNSAVFRVGTGAALGVGFPIAPGGVLNGFVQTATGFTWYGALADVIDIVEFGRV